MNRWKRFRTWMDTPVTIERWWYAGLVIMLWAQLPVAIAFWVSVL